MRRIVAITRDFKAGDRVRLEDYDTGKITNTVHLVTKNNAGARDKVTVACCGTHFVTYVQGSKKPVNCMQCLAAEIAPGED